MKAYEFTSSDNVTVIGYGTLTEALEYNKIIGGTYYEFECMFDGLDEYDVYELTDLINA